MKTVSARIVVGALAFAVAFLLATESASTGQQPETLPKPEVKDYDPTQPGPGLKGILTHPKEGKLGQPKTSLAALKGRVISKQSALAIIEIDGIDYLLPVGGEARSVKSLDFSVKVLEITNSGVKVQVAPRNETWVLR